MNSAHGFSRLPCAAQPAVANNTGRCVIGSPTSLWVAIAKGRSRLAPVTGSRIRGAAAVERPTKNPQPITTSLR